MESFDYYDSVISDNRAAIRTYSNYSAAWCLWTQRDCTPRDAQSQLNAFSQLRRSRHVDVESIRRHLLRGSLTLKLIQEISVYDKPDFAMISALWLPVQTYYAAHGFGMALLSARYGSHCLPQTHAAFMRQIAERIVPKLLPEPFSALVQNGYKGFSYIQPELINIRDDGTYIGSGLNLQHPNGTTRDVHIVQCLDTTRRRLIDAKLEKERAKAKKPGKRHGVLNRERQIAIARKVATTTIFDYLYRMRIKSNYEDPTIFHEGSEDADAVLELVRNTRVLATRVCALLAAILWRLVDERVRGQLGEEVNIDCLLQTLDTL